MGSPLPAAAASPRDRAFRFWRWWLLAALAGTAVIGYSVLWLHGPWWAWHQERVATALWGHPGFSPETDAYRRWMAAVLGSTMAAWSVALMWIAAVPFRRRERWAWWAIATSLLAWAPVDTTVSALHGVTVNVVFNLAAVVLVGLPLGATYRDFRRPRSASPDT